MKLKAFIEDYGMTISKTGNPQIMIQFSCEDEKKRTWWGSLKEGKAREITLDTILRCGFTGDDPLNLANGKKTGLLDENLELELVIENETLNSGKTIEKIKWINIPGGNAFANAITQSDAVQKFQGLNLKGDLLARKQVMAHEPVPSRAANDEEDLPF